MSTTDQYRKKPIVIEAWQLCFGNNEELAGNAPDWLRGDQNVSQDGETLSIRTLEGVMLASDGDWIIKGVAGELYPCKPAIFAATYEPAPAPSSPSPDGMIERPWRCDITRNPVGTDTVFIGAPPCDCQGCRAAAALSRLRAELEEAKAERKLWHVAWERAQQDIAAAEASNKMLIEALTSAQKTLRSFNLRDPLIDAALAGERKDGNELVERLLSRPNRDEDIFVLLERYEAERAEAAAALEAAAAKLQTMSWYDDLLNLQKHNVELSTALARAEADLAAARAGIERLQKRDREAGR